ncbi:YppG family protein [Ornithinibacillus californiensis]|uniref:YppG family protein n=1 Tax=Ornithinibacillus californiensis TaxID=161536 RepID=UPI00069F297F|nr:YppG family protein [Ornithinibacillus californiensis]
MRHYGYPPYQRQIPPNYQQQIQQPFHGFQQQQPPYYQNLYEQPKSPFEQFAKPKQPQDWYANNEQLQGNNQQAQPQMMSQFQEQNGQMNLDKMLTTVSQIANTYHQVSPIIKQFGDFMKTFR